jgi:hypothetical protein
MPHPHQAYLNEFKISVDKMVPLTPPEVMKEAKDLYDQLLADESTTNKAIHQALTLVGRKEIPYRKAYQELCAGDEEKRLQACVFERLDADVRKKIEEMTNHGVILEEYVKSDLFEEQLSGEDRYSVEQAILLADDVLDHQCDERAHKRKKKYDDLVMQWQKEVARLQGMIDHLRSLGSEDPKWISEINSTADRLEEGWSIVERDPTEEEIKKEIEYWNTVLHEGDENAL